MTKYFYLSTCPETRWTDAHAAPGYKPVLNDLPGKGDLVHTSSQAAWQLAQDIAYDLAGARGLDVIEIDVADELVAALKRSGDISDNGEPDCFGNPLVKLSATASNLINGSASFARREFRIPEEHLAMLRDDHRSSTVMH